MSSERNTGLEVSFQQRDGHQVFHFDSGKVTIGRRTDCDVVIDDSSVSRLHATVELENGRWVLRDNGSVNGLEIDGRSIKIYPVSNDRVRMGDITINFHVGMGVQLGSEVVDSVQELTSAIDVDNLDSLLDSMLQDDEREETAFSKRAPLPLTAAEIILILRAATDAFLTGDNLDAILERVLDLVFEHLPVNQASILLFEEGEKRLTPRINRTADGGSPGEIRMSRHIADEAINSKQAVLVTDAEQDPRFNAAASIVSLGIRSAMCAPLCHKGNVSGLIYVDRRARNIFSRTHLEVLCILAGLSAAAVERAQLHARLEREKNIRERLSRYNAPAVIERIIESHEPGMMAAEEREVTVLFADIAEFTTMSEHLPARDVTALLNEVFQALTEEVFEEAGTLDKFIGDAVMVFFGAPLPHKDHAARAVRVALAMQKRIADLNTRRADDKQIGLRIGINTGPVVVGDIGAPQRKDYTVIGDTVNTACRIESYIAGNGQVVIGPATHAQVVGDYVCEEMDEVQLKGRSQRIKPYLVIEPVA